MAKNLIYGPVPSRRLGFSLGVDLVPYKICSYNCVYCQIGRTVETTVSRKAYLPADEVLSQLFKRLEEGIRPDHITLGGSGEPTLNSEIGAIIDRIKEKTDIPVAVLTNGAMFYDPAVRRSILHADVALPSFDAYNAALFEKINRPAPEVTFEKMARGLIDFRKEYSGKIWLEIFVLEGVNDTEADMRGYLSWIRKMKPDKVHLNTAVRPSAEKSAMPVPYDKLQSLCRILGDTAEVITSFDPAKKHEKTADIAKELQSMLSRRPCTLTDMAAGLGIPENELVKHIQRLMDDHIIEAVHKGADVYYQTRIIHPQDKKKNPED